MPLRRSRLPLRVLFPCLLFTGAPEMQAGTNEFWKKLWAASVAAVVAANVTDAATSAGRLEGNPLLRNAHGGLSPHRAVLIKASGTGGMILLQCLLRRRMPQHRLEKPAAVINFATAAAVGAVAYRNTTVPKAALGAP